MIKLNSNHNIPAIGLGVYQTASNTAAAIVETALRVGYRHVDTASIYHNERETCEGILRFLADKSNNPSVTRADIFYTTKIWDTDHGTAKTEQAIEHALDRLRGDSTPDEPDRTLGYIDLLLVHSPQTNAPLRRETWQAMERAVASGRVRSIGVSNYGIAHLDELLSYAQIPPAVNQVELHPWLQRRELVAYCQRHGIVLEAYSPLTRAHKLGGKDAGLVAVARRHARTEAQILVKWGLQRGFVVLPKSVHTDRIKENFNVADFDLTETDLQELGDPNSYYTTGWDPTTYKG
jgi:diketogulonate reductase-like aldo/keto reductase